MESEYHKYNWKRCPICSKYNYVYLMWVLHKQRRVPKPVTYNIINSLGNCRKLSLGRIKYYPLCYLKLNKPAKDEKNLEYSIYKCREHVNTIYLQICNWDNFNMDIIKYSPDKLAIAEIVFKLAKRKLNEVRNSFDENKIVNLLAPYKRGGILLMSSKITFEEIMEVVNQFNLPIGQVHGLQTQIYLYFGKNSSIARPAYIKYGMSILNRIAITNDSFLLRYIKRYLNKYVPYIK